MNKIFIHIDFNSFFATVEQQANPRLRGKPIGVTGGDRLERTVIGAASVEAKKFGVRTGMTYFEARKLCPEIILVKGDSDKYLECSKRFINILKDFSPNVEVFSIDEVFLEVSKTVGSVSSVESVATEHTDLTEIIQTAILIKDRIRTEIGSWISVSVGISYNKVMAKLAGSLYKPDGLVVIADPEAAMFILDRRELDDICGIGYRIKKRLNNMGVFSFADLREIPLENLLASFKSYGKTLYDFSRGLGSTEVIPFYEKEEVKSVGHRHTLSFDTDDPLVLKQHLLKLSELVATRLRAKKLVGKTISFWYRSSFNREYYEATGSRFAGFGMQTTIALTDDGLKIFEAGWKIFNSIWGEERVRMVGISISNLKPKMPQNLTILEDDTRQEVITKTLDNINNKYGDFTLKRAVLLGSKNIKRMPNSFLSDRRFKLE